MSLLVRRSPQASRLSCRSMRLAVVGDVHGQWSAMDAAALTACQADFTLFVGDFGNEAVPIVKAIADLDVPKAVICGNHDAWYTMTARARSRSRSPSPPNGEPEPDRVQAQLEALGASHVGYGHMALPNTRISLVGARPFSKGGKSLRSIREFMLSRFGILDMKDSADRILQIIHQQVPAGHTLLLLGHNGPAGLGDAPHNICGCDWLREGGDHGDPDLAAVLQQLQEEQRPPALVVFGHMHHKLQGGAGLRQMVMVDEATGTVFLNAATVPRVVPHPMRGESGARPGSRHHFLVIDMDDEGQVEAAADVWVLAHDNHHLAQEPAQVAGSSSTAAAQQKAAATGNGHGSGGTSRQQRRQQQQQQMQAPQLLLFEPQPTCADGWLVQVVQVQEVFRGAGQATPAGRQVEVWDASSSTWRKHLLPRVRPQPAAREVAVAVDTTAAAAAAAAAAVSAQMSCEQ